MRSRTVFSANLSTAGLDRYCRDVEVRYSPTTPRKRGAATRGAVDDVESKVKEGSKGKRDGRNTACKLGHRKHSNHQTFCILYHLFSLFKADVHGKVPRPAIYKFVVLSSFDSWAVSPLSLRTVRRTDVWGHHIASKPHRPLIAPNMPLICSIQAELGLSSDHVASWAS